MPNMPDPFAANLSGKKLTKYDLIQAIRTDIVGELEAIFLYDAHAEASDDPLVKAVLSDIRDEERAHCGELLTLLKYLDPATAEHLTSGESEVKEMMEELGIAPPSAAAAPEAPAAADAGAPTVGSLKE